MSLVKIFGLQNLRYICTNLLYIYNVLISIFETASIVEIAIHFALGELLSDQNV